MGFETEIMKGFDDYCREKRNAIAKISNEEKRAGQEKVLVARSLLHHEAQQMAARYAKQEDSNAALFGELQEATVLDSLDIDLSDVEEEFRAVFEPECIYNTLVLLVTAVKNYCEFLEGIYEKQKGGR